MSAVAKLRTTIAAGVAGLGLLLGLCLPAPAGQDPPAVDAASPPRAAKPRRAGPDWWAFRPIRRPPVTKTALDLLADNPIDHFIVARLAAKGLSPAPPADRLTLLRRVTFDLCGLPPAPPEIEAFLADTAPNAYEKVVDRLLASPAYGERWARHWLDVVRFGESNGYEQNHLRPNAWPYRDYVIDAFNRDKPYDRFVQEQLAGDALAREDPAAEVGTGFLVAGVHDTVGNATVEGTLQQRASDLDDIVSTVGATFLGLTVGCARCHDHKFDPIPQKDYYRLTAVFAGVRHGERPLGQTAVSLEAQRQAEKLRRKLYRSWAELMDLATVARTKVLRSEGIDPVPRPAVHISRNVDEFPAQKAKFVRLTILATQKGDEPALDELEVYGPAGKENLALASRGGKATASSVLPGYAIHQVSHLNDDRYGNDFSWISNEPGRGWAQIELPRAQAVNRVIWSRDASILPRFHDRLASRYKIEVSLDGKVWRTVSTGEDRALSHESIPYATLYKHLDPDQQERWRELSAELARGAREIPTEPPSMKMAYVGQFSTPDLVYVLKRGEVLRRGEMVTPGALSRLSGLSSELPSSAGAGEPGRRLALAQWITDPRNPLTARVLVNRVWHYHFGQGIVATPSDFGFGGARPTHPELLDWLAADFVDHGWSMKHLHRLIVTSATYRQATGVRPEGERMDAGNRLLWHMPLRRLEAEALRDAVLATSGKLDRTMGGPGFRLFKYRTMNVAIYEPLDEQGQETWRRAIYRQQARAIREDLLGGFDCPECAQRTPRRDVTTTALQALTLLNGPFITGQAAQFADRVQQQAGTQSEAQVALAFRLAFGRQPTSAERDAGTILVRRHGLAALCRVLLNANEFLYY